MTRRFAVAAVMAVVVVVSAGQLIVTASCVFPEVGLGAPCEQQSECLSGDACVRIDPADPDEDNVCLPMLELDAPQACIVDEDCPAAGFPVDSFCDGEGRCTCDVDDGFTCDGLDEVLGEHTCRCLPAAIATDDECEDDDQCVSFHCGDGTCVEGLDGDGCDSDEDCQLATTATCNAGTCE